MTNPRAPVCARLAAFFLAVSVSIPALADWRFTTWRMTPDEVVVAADGTADMLANPIVLDSGLEIRVTGSFRTESHNYDVYFAFRPQDDLLDLVALELKNGSETTVYELLRARHGEPYDDDAILIPSGQSHVARFKDEDLNNRISYFLRPEDCWVYFVPLARGEAPD